MPTESNTGRRKVTVWNHIRAILLLPFMNTVIIPSTLLILFEDARFWGRASVTGAIASIGAFVSIAIGLSLVIRAISLFVRLGRGTLAPWDPTEVLITEDVYRLSRNPMKAGLFLILIGEALLLRSTAITIWAAAFISVNAVYIRWSEEPGLRARFGPAYDAYCERVPRWLRLLPARRHAGHTAERWS